MMQKIPFRAATVSRIARPDDEVGRERKGWGEETILSFEINIHPCTESNVIIINYPGYGGDIDGYQNKYRKLAHLLQRSGVGAVVRMGNHCRCGFRYEKSVVDDLKATIGYALENANSMCSTSQPDLYLMGFSAGAGAIAIVSGDYEPIKRILERLPIS